METEKIIRRIEELKRMSYGNLCENEGLDDPSVLAQVSQRLLGEQSAYDSVIYMLRKLQGSDDE